MRFWEEFGERGTASIIAARVLVVAATPAAAGDPPAAREPYSCRLQADAQRQCVFGSCDRRVIERLKGECLRDGGRP